MDLLNIEPQEMAAREELWFSNPDPYDLDKTDRVDPVLQLEETFIRYLPLGLTLPNK
jgi:hypothetical protein